MIDETTLEATRKSTSGAGREGPEMKSELLRLAPLGIRAAARCIDFVILFLLFEIFTGSVRRKFVELICLILAGVFGLRIQRMYFHALVFCVLTGGVFLQLALIYFVCNYWSLLNSGRSLGKRMTQICIADGGVGSSFRPVGFGRLFRREALFIFAITPFFVAQYYGPPPPYETFGYGLSVSLLVFGLLPAFFASRRSILDRISGTRVYRLKPVEPFSSASALELNYAESDCFGTLDKGRMRTLDDEGDAVLSASCGWAEESVRKSCDRIPERAPLWRRTFAWGIDAFMLILVVEATTVLRQRLFAGVVNLFPRLVKRVQDEESMLVLLGVLLCVHFAYVVLVYFVLNYRGLSRSGWSIGKSLMKVRIVCMEGGRMGIARVLLREMPFLIAMTTVDFFMDFLLVVRFLAPGFIWDFCWNNLGFILMFYVKMVFVVFVADALPGLFGLRRCVHDYLADTRVCGAKPEGGRCRVLRG